MSGRRSRVRSEAPVETLVAGLTVDELRQVVLAAVDRHADVERQVRLVAGRGAGDLAQLRVEVDRGLRTRRFLAGARAGNGRAPLGLSSPSWRTRSRRLRRGRWSSCCSARSVTS